MLVETFSKEVAGVIFKFNTLSSKSIRAFQVYVLHEGKQLRFHMQTNSEGTFYITDPDHCPKVYFDLEVALGEAIYSHHTAAVPSKL
jgi:hypothetical protein